MQNNEYQDGIAPAPTQHETQRDAGSLPDDIEIGGGVGKSSFTSSFET